MILFMAFGANGDSTVITEEGLAILCHFVHHTAVRGGAIVYQLLLAPM